MTTDTGLKTAAEQALESLPTDHAEAQEKLADAKRALKDAEQDNHEVFENLYKCFTETREQLEATINQQRDNAKTEDRAASISPELVQEYIAVRSIEKLCEAGKGAFLEYAAFCETIKDEPDAYFKRDHSKLYLRTSFLGDEEDRQSPSDEVQYAFKMARRECVELLAPNRVKELRGDISRRSLLGGAVVGILGATAGAGTAYYSQEPLKVLGIAGSFTAGAAFLSTTRLISNHLAKTQAMPFYEQLLNQTSEDRGVERASLKKMLEITMKINAVYAQKEQSSEAAPAR